MITKIYELKDIENKSLKYKNAGRWMLLKMKCFYFHCYENDAKFITHENYLIFISVDKISFWKIIPRNKIILFNKCKNIFIEKKYYS